MTSSTDTLYLAPADYQAELLGELGADAEVVAPRLVRAPGPRRQVAWAQNVWLNPERLTVRSIGDATKQLKARQRNWALFPTAHHRRAALIVDGLPKVSGKPVTFPTPAPTSPLGSFALITPDTLWAAGHCTSPFANGEVAFVEDKFTPPNRAYLKLWEALTVVGAYPRPGERCLDFGASPGGWTWVAASLGAQVVAVDRAELAPHIAAMPGVEALKQNAFTLEPQSVGPIDWWLCDVIAYPDKTLELVRRWLDSGLVRRMVCSVKFQGPTDLAMMAKFQAISGARVRHLFHNKHEVTFLWFAEGLAEGLREF